MGSWIWNHAWWYMISICKIKNVARKWIWNKVWSRSKLCNCGVGERGKLRYVWRMSQGPVWEKEQTCAEHLLPHGQTHDWTTSLQDTRDELSIAPTTSNSTCLFRLPQVTFSPHPGLYIPHLHISLSLSLSLSLHLDNNIYILENFKAQKT